MTRPRRRGGFGYIVSKGTTTHPLFAIRWREGSTHKQRSGFKTKKAAADELAAVRAGLADGSLIENRRAEIERRQVEIGFDQAAQDWLRLHSAPNLRSHKDNADRYERHVSPVLGKTPLGAITAAHVLELRAKLQTKILKRRRVGADGKVHEVNAKLKPRTINLVMALVRSILKFAVANKHIASAPTGDVGRGKLMLSVETPKLAPPIPTEEDAGRLLGAIQQIGEERHRPSLYPLFATLLYTGVRRGEALGLRWTDCDFDQRVLYVRHSYAGTTKSKRHRLVPMPTGLVAILRAYRLADPWKGELMFPNDEGVLYSAHAKLQAVLHEGLRRVGLLRIRIHDLRHAFASFFVMSGGDIFTLQRILGHSSPQLTSDIYGHLSPKYLAREADRISYPAPAAPGTVIPFDQSAKRADSAREEVG